MNTSDLQQRLPQQGGNVSRQDVLRGIANEQEYHRRINNSQRRNESPHKKSNDLSTSVKRSNSGRSIRKDLQPNSSPSQTRRRRNEVLQSINNRMHYRSDDNISRTYENSAMFDHLNGNLSSPSARRSHRHHSDDDNISLRRRNSKTETNSSNENIHSNSLSRRSRAARNERYYKRLSRDHEVEKLVLPLSPKQKHRVMHQTNSLPMSTPNTKTNYAPRYPNFQKISQPYYNMNSTYPLPQSVNSSSSSINRTVIPHHSSRSAVVNRSRLSSSSTASSYPQNSTYPPQQNLSRLSSSSTLSHVTSSNYPTFPSTDNNMRLVHAIPFKSVSYESSINNNYPQLGIHPVELKSISYDNINQNPLIGGRKVPPNPPPRNPNRKTIALYEAPSQMVQSSQNRHSSHQPYDYNVEANKLYPSDGISKIPYKESYTGERAYLITQAHPSNMMNISDNFIRHEKSQNNSQRISSQESIKPLGVNQSYFHHKDNPQVQNDSFYPDNRYTNNDRLNEPNQYIRQHPNTENTNNNIQFYSATSKVISSSPKVSPGQSWNHNGEQLYENTPAIRAQISSQQNKRPSSISPSDSQFNKRSFTDQNFPDSQSLLKTQRLTRSNETLPYDENLSRINEIGIPIHPGFTNGHQKVRAPSIKRPLKGRQSLEIKETVRPLSIVLEKSENELESDRIGNMTSSNSFKFRISNKPKEVKLNENGLRITSNSKNLMGSASNLDDALTELEQIYESLNLNDEDLLDRAERRDLPTCYQINKDQVRDTPEVEEINRILGNSNNPNRTHSMRRLGIPNKVNDDMAIRKYRYQNENVVNTSNSETGSYLLTSPTLSPPPFFEDKPASPVVDVDGEPDVTRDDVVYRNTKYVNNLLKPHDPQPFGIPLRPVINASSTDYLHVTPDTEKYRSTFHNAKTPDVVTDDLAYRNLRKDYKDYNTLQNFHLIPAFRSERDRNSSPYYDKDQYLSNIDYEERFQRRKKRAMRSLSGNLFMRDYHANESDPIPNEYLRPNVPSNVVRSQTTSPEYHLANINPIQESDFERLKDRWLNTPSPEDMEKMKNRDKSVLTYIDNNSTRNKKMESIIKNNTESLLREPSEDVNINSGVENLRKKFVISKTSDRSNPFKKMLNDDFDITPEIESIRKKFVHNKIKSGMKNLKSVEESEKTLKETDYKNNFKNIKNQFNSELTKTKDNHDSNERTSESPEKKNETKEVTKANRNNKENPFVSKFENIRSIFSTKTNEEEVKELMKPKKKIKKFRETNNNSYVSRNDYSDYKSNMDRSIDCLKRRSQAEDSNHSNLDDTIEDTSISDSSQTEGPCENVDSNNVCVEQKLDDSNPMCKDDELLQQLAKETTETSEQINQKLRQLSTNIVQHKTIKLNQFPITLEDDNVENCANAEKDTKIDKQSILKSVQTVSIESEYDNIPRSGDAVGQLENEINHEEALCFDDLDIPQDTNTYEKLDYTKLVKVGSSGEKEENSHTNVKPLERNQASKAQKDNYSKQISTTSEYDNVPFSNQDIVSLSTNVQSQTANKNKEILVKRIDATKFTSDDDNEPFVSLTMKNVPSEDLESTTTSDNEVMISELSDDGLNSQDMDLINNYFQNGKTINTVGIKISEIKNLNFESDSSFNSEIQNIFSPQTKSNFDEDGTDSEIENLPIDLQIEILENKSISSLDNDSNLEDFQRNLILKNDNKDKYSLELEDTLDTGLNSETRSESLRTLCQSPVEEVESRTNSKHVENSMAGSSNDKTVEPETSVTNDIRPDHDDGLETNLSHTKDSSTNQIQTHLSNKDHIEDKLDVANVSSCDLALARTATDTKSVESPNKTESIVSPKLKDKEVDHNDEEVKPVATLEEPNQICDTGIIRSKSNENIRQSNGKLKSQSEKHAHESPVPLKPVNGFGKCCSSSSSSNLDLCSSEGSSKSSSNQCRDLTPVRRRRSLPESPPVKLSLSSMCAHLTRPEGVI
uniref:Uncharacterized protein n=1 Tax=Cacopsylla melanoneura TaxID=428564 RepID=A0A8D8XL47_9HEMI